MKLIKTTELISILIYRVKHKERTVHYIRKLYLNTMYRIFRTNNIEFKIDHKAPR